MRGGLEDLCGGMGLSKGLPGIALPNAPYVPEPERTYTQSEVEKYFAEAESMAEQYGPCGDVDLRDLYKVAYLRGRFGIGGAE